MLWGSLGAARPPLPNLGSAGAGELQHVLEGQDGPTPQLPVHQAGADPLPGLVQVGGPIGLAIGGHGACRGSADGAGEAPEQDRLGI